MARKPRRSTVTFKAHDTAEDAFAKVLELNRKDLVVNAKELLDRHKERLTEVRIWLDQAEQEVRDTVDYLLEIARDIGELERQAKRWAKSARRKG